MKSEMMAIALYSGGYGVASPEPVHMDTNSLPG